MKNIKGIFLSLLLSLIFPLTASALSTDYVSINDKENLNVQNLSFTDLTFNDNTATSTQSFGLTGAVINNSSNTYYTADVSYYDSNYNLITRLTKNELALKGLNYLSLMSRNDSLNGHSVNEIKYYRLDITTTSNESMSQITPSESGSYSSYDYVIDSYNINMQVNDDNTFDITETITAYFNKEKHGIYRKISLKNTIQRLDGTTSANRATVTNLEIDNKYTISKSGGYYQIQIGDPYKTLTGKQTYTIKYTYNIGKDPIKDYDEFYFNLIGDEWDTVIGNISFNITMPKEFDPSKLGFSSGLKGSIDNSKIIYNVSGNTISGSYNGILNKNEALTIRLELPEGYIKSAKSNLNLGDYIMIIVPLIGLIISFLLWFIFGRDKKPVETVEFYPPEGFNSLEIGFLYKGKAENKDVVSLLIYLADKGYIKITETNDKSLFSNVSGIKITKLKDYDGNNYSEKKFMEGLFTGSLVTSLISKMVNQNQETVNPNEVYLSSLYNSFYITIDDILRNMNSKENKDKIFEKKSTRKKAIIILFILLSYILITSIPIISLSDVFNLPFALIFPATGFGVLFGLVFGQKNIIVKIFGLIWGLAFGGIPFCIFILPLLMQDPIYAINYLFGIICIIGMFIFFKYLPKRTPYGNELLGKIKGFKNFLEVAEKSQLESEVMKNPNYFYDIIPYAYVLGVSDKWVSKFEGIAMQVPDWYSGASFTLATFNTFMTAAMTSAETAMTSHPSSSSSGGSSGGGSSGGGSGGGGGVSW